MKPQHIFDAEYRFSENVSKWMDAEAQNRGYNSFSLLMSFVGSSNAQRRKDAEVAEKWRDAVYIDMDELFARYEAGKTGGLLPDFAEWLINAPVLDWED